jgi:hypothetical protein
MGGRCCCCGSNTCCSDCRNTVFQASPRHSIASIANAIHAKLADPRNDNSAHGGRITVSNAASVTDTLRDRNPDKASAASTVINSPRPLFAAYNRQSFPRPFLNSTPFLQVPLLPMALSRGCDDCAPSCKLRSAARPPVCAFQGLCCIRAFYAQISSVLAAQSETHALRGLW